MDVMPTLELCNLVRLQEWQQIMEIGDGAWSYGYGIKLT